MLERTIAWIGDDSEPAVNSLWQILGPLFILLTLLLAPKDALILCVGAMGLFLSARWQIRGFSYALVLLGIAATAEHAFLTSHHLWQLGLEGSYAVSFFITAMASEQRSSEVQSLNAFLDAKSASLRNLEEELTQEREASTVQQMVLQEKIDALQKELEEAQSETSSLFILNEVLRKTSAVHVEEKEAVKRDLLDCQKHLASLTQFETLYKQLRSQFEEKNAVLHQTRAECFHLDTQLQALQKEKEEWQANPMSQEMQREVSALEQELSALERENLHLQDLVTLLSVVKKK